MVTPATRLGWRGEYDAQRWLEGRGFIFVGRNIRSRGGEIDLVMMDGQTTVFIEVKIRRSALYGYPEESISDKKLEKLRMAIDQYCQSHPEVKELRLDAVFIEMSEQTTRIRHLRGIG